jgi:hypothetical protein
MWSLTSMYSQDADAVCLGDGLRLKRSDSGLGKGGSGRTENRLTYPLLSIRHHYREPSRP